MEGFLKVLGKIGAVLFVLSFAILAGFIAIVIPASNSNFYKQRFREVDENGRTAYDYVLDETYFLLDDDTARFVYDMTEDDLVFVMKHVVRYCFYLEKDLNPTIDGYQMQFFREDEISHMKDVKRVFGAGLVMVGVSLVVFIVTLCFGIIKRKSYYHNCRKIPIYALICVFIAVFTVGILAVANFDKAFDIFHNILFNGNWEFVDGIMIKMIGYIFDDILPIILTIWLSLLALLGVAVKLFEKKSKK